MAYATPTLSRIGRADDVVLGTAVVRERDRVIVGGMPVEPLPQLPYTSDGVLDSKEPLIPES